MVYIAIDVYILDENNEQTNKTKQENKQDSKKDIEMRNKTFHI